MGHSQNLSIPWPKFCIQVLQIEKPSLSRLLLALHALPAYIIGLINSISCRLRQLLNAQCHTSACDDREVKTNKSADSCWCKKTSPGSKCEPYSMVSMKPTTRNLHCPEGACNLNNNTFVTEGCVTEVMRVSTRGCVCWTLAFTARWCLSFGT